MSVVLRRATRILVGASCYADAQEALQLVEKIIATDGSEISGILVAQEAVITARHRIVTPSGEMAERPTQSAWERSVNADAKAFRERLSNLAENQKLQWSLNVLRGDLAERAWEAGQGRDVIVLGHRLLRPGTGKLVIVTAGEPSESIRSFAEGVARILRCDIVTLDAEDEATLTLLNRLNAAAVVTEQSAGLERLREIVETARCPVFALREPAEKTA